MDITRLELYNLVWNKPLTHLAREYGFSDVGFAKICKKHNIPLPPRGYWARVSAGFTPKIKSLPKSNDDRLIRIDVKPAISENEIHQKKKALESKKSAISLINISIPDEITSPHKYTRNTEIYFAKLIKRVAAINQQKTMPNDYYSIISSVERGRLICHQPNCFKVAVSESLLNRALIFLDVLAKELEARGFMIKYLENDNRSRSVVAVKENESISFQLSEGYKYQPTKKTPKNKLDSILYPDKEPVPTGKLTLIINERMSEIGRSWTDGKNLIESRLPEIINEFSELVPIQKQQKIDRIAREQKREEQALEFHKLQAIRFHEKSLFEEAINEAHTYRDLQMLKSYLNDLEIAINSNDVLQNEIAKNWFYTIRELMESHDPFNKRLDFLISQNN